MARKVTRIRVEGMECAACAASVTKALEAIDGVGSADVNIGTETATVEHDVGIPIAELVTAVEGAGYGVARDEARVPVGGLDCAACAGPLESALRSLDGVIEASVNIASEEVRVTFDPMQVTIGRIRAAIRDSGFEPLDVGQVMVSRAETARDVRFRAMSIAIVFGVPTMVLSMLFMWTSFMGDVDPFLRGVLLLALATPVQFVAGRQFYAGAYHALIARTSNMDTLVALSTTVAYVASVAILIDPDLLVSDTLFFEASAMIITLVLTGRYLESRAKARTSEAVRGLIDLQPRMANVVDDGERSVPVEYVRPGDIFVVRPGEQVPVDGRIVDGSVTLDESMVTGEPIPVERSVGDDVIAGTMDVNGLVTAEAVRVGDQTTLSRIVRMVQDAQGTKGDMQRLADRVVSYFTPLVLSIAIAALVFWYAWGYDVFDGSGGKGAFCITVFITVLVIACPCALGLATPLAIMAGTGIGARHGILIKNGAAMERASGLRTVAFDKTGTLTKGRPEVVSISSSMDEGRLMVLVSTAEYGSEHPYSRAIQDRAVAMGIEPGRPEGFEYFPGKGLAAIVDGSEVIIGNRALQDEAGVDVGMWVSRATGMQREGMTALFVSVDDEAVAVLGIEDPIRADAAAAIARVRSLDMVPVMVTGDDRGTAEAVASRVGIERIVANVLPDGKVDVVRSMMAEGAVAMVGDGINDAPALATADIGIALGSGTDIAVETGDVVVIGDSPMDAVEALVLARRIDSKIRQNLFWAFIYNVIAIPIAAGALFPFSGVLLPPVAGAAAMALSDVCVVTNAALLTRWSPRRAAPIIAEEDDSVRND